MQRSAKVSAVDLHRGSGLLLVAYNSGTFDLYQMPAFTHLQALSVTRHRITSATFNGEPARCLFCIIRQYSWITTMICCTQYRPRSALSFICDSGRDWQLGCARMCGARTATGLGLAAGVVCAQAARSLSVHSSRSFLAKWITSGYCRR